MSDLTFSKSNIKRLCLLLVQLVLIAIGGYFMFMFVFPIFGVIFNIGSVLGAVMSLAVILLGIFLPKIIAFVKLKSQTKKGKTIVCSVISVLLVCLLCFFSVLGSIIASAKTDAKGADTIIVLGCAVRKTTPSYTLKRRIAAAYDYLNENPESKAVLSGGKGNGEDISEAECIYEHLCEKGIDPDRLYIEDKSTNTEENIAYSKKIIKDNSLSENVAVVSSDYHLKRAKMICKKEGLGNVGTISSGSSYFDKPTFFLREVLGVVKEFITK